MRSFLKNFFNSEKIEFFGEITAENLKIIQPHLMPENIKSAVVWLIPYYTGKHENRNISLYAVSKDYHLYAKALGARLVNTAKAKYPDEEFYTFCDSSPINDIAAAITSGLGVLGKNRLLINEKYGSYIFIGCMLTTLEADSPVEFSKKDCIGCGKCIESCGFLSGKQDFCHSELNQRKELTEAELNTVKSKKIRWGCDICQEICPMNKDASVTPIKFFHNDIIENVTPELLEAMSKTQFRERAFAWRGKKTILRNVSE